MKPFVIIASVLTLAAGSAFAAPNCPNGVACGNTCIAKTATCKAPH